MVEHQDEQVEWQNLLKVRYRLSDRLKCIPGGVGCLLLQPEDRGFMVTPGTHDAHQLSRATCSNPCNQNVCQIQDSNIHPAKNRKYHNSSLYKQSWGTASKKLVLLTRDLWMWCLERNIHITAVHLPWIMNAIANTESQVI